MLLGCFWDAFGMGLGCFWDGFGMVLGWFWEMFGHALGMFCACFDILLLEKHRNPTNRPNQHLTNAFYSEFRFESNAPYQIAPSPI